MQKKAILALLLAAALMLSGCALVEKDNDVDRATTVITVGDTTFTKGEVLDQADYSLNYMAYIYQMYGQAFDTTSAENIRAAREDTVQGLIEQAVKEAKVKELGLDQFTEEETADLAAQVDSQWSSNLDSVKSNYFADSELTGEELDAAVEKYLTEDLNVSKETVEQNIRSSMEMDKLREYAIKDVAITDEEIQSGFDSKVEEAKTNYESSLSSYGSAVNNGTTVYYRPAGYRMVKQILIQFNQEDKDIISDLKQKRSAENSVVTNMTTSLKNLEANTDELLVNVHVSLVEGDELTCETTTDFPEGTDPDVADQVQKLAEAQEKLAYYDQKISEATDNAYANIDAAADDVIARLDAGEDFDTVMAEKTQDPGMQGDAATAKTGYAVCEGFTTFDSAFVSAAMALENVGDVSEKTKGSSDGYYIIKYVSDVEEGPVALDDVKETLSSELLSSKQDTVYDDTLASWVTEAKPKTNWKAIER